MKLEILDPDNNLSENFGIWLTRKIQSKMISDINPNKLIQWNKFFEESDEYVSISKTPIKTDKILLAGIKAYYSIHVPGKVIVCMRKNQFVPGLDRVKLDVVCRLINFGNNEISGYPIFTTTLQYFVDNINKYVDDYALKGAI